MPLKDEIPKVWKELGMWLHQDFFICFPKPDEGLAAFWSTISVSQRKELLELLRTINHEDCVGGMLKKYWKLSGAQISPVNVKVFLKNLEVTFESL